MKSLNRVFLMGNLGHEPELKMSAAGKPYTRLNVATHRRAKIESAPEGEEQWKDITDWHSVFVWGTQAEQCANYLKKGALVFVEGALSYWAVAQGEDAKAADGKTKHYKNAISADSVKFLNTGRTAERFVTIDKDAGASDHNAVAHPH